MIKATGFQPVVVYIEHDSYYRDLGHLPLDERRKMNFDHPDALETELLVAHLRQLQAGKSIEAPIYDFATYCRSQETRHVEPRRVILVEGILIFADKELRQMMDVKLYVDTDADLRFIRRLQRDIQERDRTMESVVQQYLTTVRPMHLEFVEPSKRHADIIIPAGGFNKAAIEMIAGRIQGMLGEDVAQEGSTSPR